MERKSKLKNFIIERDNFMKKKFSFKTWLSKIVIMLITVSVIQWPVPVYAETAVSGNAVSDNAGSGNTASAPLIRFSRN